MMLAASRLLRCSPLDDVDALEDLLARFDLLWRPDDEEPPAPGLLDALSYALAAAWLRGCWTPTDLRRRPWHQVFGFDVGTYA